MKLNRGILRPHSGIRLNFSRRPGQGKGSGQRVWHGFASCQPMSKTVKGIFFGLLLVSSLLFGLFSLWQEVPAQQDDTAPTRQAEIVVSITEYVWWLIRWKNNEIVCAVIVDEEGLPSPLDVLVSCGEELYEEWIRTPPCPSAAEAHLSSRCPGLYLFLADIRPGERRVVVELPVPTIWLTLAGCTPTPPQNICERVPDLLFMAEEPLPNEEITDLHVLIGNLQYNCTGNRCQIPMTATRLSGADIEFWADSTYGDQSARFTARVRILDGGPDPVTQKPIWFVDVISSQWFGSEVSSCAASWGAFPPVGDPPKWLSTPDDVEALSSDTPFVFLAGQLILKGLVDASGCPRDGLLPNSAANACGLERSRAIVSDWQNQFDPTILEVARKNSLPAFLLKNVFAQESQFWPGEIIEDEFGLGQITELGSDAPLLWNFDFFAAFCPLVLHESTCEEGYAHLDPFYQEMLRGALASGTNANCPDCQAGIDLTLADSTVELFAQTLLGNCDQVSFIVHDITGEIPGTVSSYEDLWRYTLVNYNAGPGCLATAVEAAWPTGSDLLTWTDVMRRLTPGCSQAISYVQKVTRSNPLGEADFLFTPTPSPLPTLTPRPSPTNTPGATATSAAPYPVETATASPTSPTPVLTPTGPYP